MELVTGKKIVLDAPAAEGKNSKRKSLMYVNDTMKGISRWKEKEGFSYQDAQGHDVKDELVLKRINSLVIPPAWEQVWVCSREDGHLQATGIDQKGRKQYRYHPDWNEFRNHRKYTHLLDFGKKLPLIRKKIQADLSKPGLPEEKVIALVLSIMQKTLIRIGNTVYADLYHSYGLTTLKNRHVQISGAQVTFHFKGKKGVEHDISIKDSRLSRLLKKIKDLPGQELFQYVDSEGQRKSVDSGRVNAYLHEACGEEFSAKDIRTWSGTAYMLHLLAQSHEPETDAACKKNIVALLDQVARYLGNTRTVCKKYYVHPDLISAYEKRALGSYLEEICRYGGEAHDENGLSYTEKVLMNFLKDLSEQQT